MKSLVVYSSQSGNTKKLAQAMYESLTASKAMYPVSEAPDPAGYDFIALGFWLQAGKPDPKSAEYLAKIGKKPLFLFATHGAAAGSQHALAAMDYASSLAPEAHILGTYSCQGEVNPKVLEKASSKPEPPVWLADAPNAAGHPDEADIDVLKRRISKIMAAEPK
jgi:flavodoxin